MRSEDRVYTVIKQKILDQEYGPDFQLKEIPLSEDFGITRTHVRKAITRLSSEGLVTTYPNRGAFVVSLTSAEVEEIWEVREALEVKAALLVIRRASREELDRLGESLEERSRQLGNDTGHKYFVPEVDFHHELVRLCRNDTLISFWEQIYTRLKLARVKSAMTGGRFLRALEEHKEILARIYENRPDEVERLLRRHLAGSNINRFVP